MGALGHCSPSKHPPHDADLWWIADLEGTFCGGNSGILLGNAHLGLVAVDYFLLNSIQGLGRTKLSLRLEKNNLKKASFRALKSQF